MKIHTTYFGLMLALLLGCCPLVAAQQLFVNTALGRDNNAGTKEQPLKTLGEAARRVNRDTTSNASEIVVAEGLYVLTETALFKHNRPYTATARLTIRAEVLPDDPAWHPQRMPTIVTAAPLMQEEAGETGNGLQIEVSHATIQGFRITGGLDYYYKNVNQTRRTYPVMREGKNLDDLLVTQCLFMGDEQVMPLQVGVIANGHGVVVEHCIFYNVRNSVVFWRAEGGTSNRNAMRNCLVYGASGSGVWTVETNGDDFDFRNNIITNAAIAWIRERGGTRKYKAVNCLFANNDNMAGYGAGPGVSKTLTDTSFLSLQDLKQAGKVVLEMNRGKRDYLHVAQDSLGADLKAGLFTKE